MINTKLAAVIAANRFGLGARPGELAAIGDDPRARLIAQLDGPRTPPAAIAQLQSSQEAFRVYADFIEERRELKKEDVVKGDAKEELSPLRKAIR
ncbi:MAG: DUF1800 domain-containing protein, partial [Steroidobacter sp.]